MMPITSSWPVRTPTPVALSTQAPALLWHQRPMMTPAPMLAPPSITECAPVFAPALLYASWMHRALVVLLVLSVTAPLVSARVQYRLPRVLLFGDSIATGYGLPAGDAFPARLLAVGRAQRRPFLLAVDAVDGRTVDSGLPRIALALRVHRPDVVVLAVGGNDLLRGTSPVALRVSMDRLVCISVRSGARVLVAGMLAPEDFGADYAAAFRAAFADSASRYGAAYLPFLLVGVAADPAYNQSDFVHPNRRGALRVALTVWSMLAALLPPIAVSTPPPPPRLLACDR